MKGGRLSPMLNNISKQINAELKKEQDQKDFYMLIHEDTEYENFIDNRILNLSENGVNEEMLKNEMPFLFIEDTVVDDDLITNLQNEVDYEDNYEKKPISDSDETTKLQEPEDFKDDFSTQYASDADADTKLNKEVDYADNQKTPVNIDEFSNEAVDLLFEMGDILGALELMEAAECDGTLLKVSCPDEGETIPQADEADVKDTESPKGGLVEPTSKKLVSEADAEEVEEADDDDTLEEEFNALFESSDEDEDEDEDEEDESSDEDESDDESEEDEDCDDEEECDEDKDEKKDENLKESFSILDWFA